LARRSPLPAGVALQHWPRLRLALHTAPEQHARLILASSVGHAAWAAAGLLLTVRELPLPADGPPPPGFWPEDLIDATVPDVLAAAFWPAAAPTGWAGVLIGRRYPTATELLPTLFLTTRLAYQAPASPGIPNGRWPGAGRLVPPPASGSPGRQAFTIAVGATFYVALRVRKARLANAIFGTCRPDWGFPGCCSVA